MGKPLHLPYPISSKTEQDIESINREERKITMERVSKALLALALAVFLAAFFAIAEGGRDVSAKDDTFLNPGVTPGIGGTNGFPLGDNGGFPIGNSDFHLPWWWWWPPSLFNIIHSDVPLAWWWLKALSKTGPGERTGTALGGSRFGGGEVPKVDSKAANGHP